MSQMTMGSSVFTARPTASALRFIPGPEVDGDRNRAAESGADRGAYARDLILGLEGIHVEVFVAREFMQDVAGRE